MAGYINTPLSQGPIVARIAGATIAPAIINATGTITTTDTTDSTSPTSAASLKIGGGI